MVIYLKINEMSIEKKKITFMSRIFIYVLVEKVKVLGQEISVDFYNFIRLKF